MDLSMLIVRISNSYFNLYKYPFCKLADLIIMYPTYVSVLVILLTCFYILLKTMYVTKYPQIGCVVLYVTPPQIRK